MTKTISLAFYLVVGQKFSASGFAEGKPTIRTTVRKPAVDQDEVPIQLTLELPAALFRRPTLAARVTVPDTTAPVEISAELQRDIARVIQEQLGVVLRVVPDQPNQEE